jgi:hypothetical protein
MPSPLLQCIPHCENSTSDVRSYGAHTQHLKSVDVERRSYGMQDVYILNNASPYFRLSLWRHWGVSLPCILDKYAVAGEGTLVWSNTWCSRVRLFNTLQYNSIQCVHVRSSVHPSVYNTKEYNTIQCVHVRSSDRPSVRSYLNSVKPCHGTFLWTFAGTSIITIIQSSINKEYNTIQYNTMRLCPFIRSSVRAIVLNFR